jgi:hypothetical protein
MGLSFEMLGLPWLGEAAAAGGTKEGFWKDSGVALLQVCGLGGARRQVRDAPIRWRSSICRSVEAVQPVLERRSGRGKVALARFGRVARVGPSIVSLW